MVDEYVYARNYIRNGQNANMNGNMPTELEKILNHGKKTVQRH